MTHDLDNLAWTTAPFWQGFFKTAAIKLPTTKLLPRIPKIRGYGQAAATTAEELPQGVKTMSEQARAATATPSKIKPAAEPLNYAEMYKPKRQPAGTLTYGSMGVESYTPPPKPPKPE